MTLVYGVAKWSINSMPKNEDSCIDSWVSGGHSKVGRSTTSARALIYRSITNPCRTSSLVPDKVLERSLAFAQKPGRAMLCIDDAKLTLVYSRHMPILANCKAVARRPKK